MGGAVRISSSPNVPTSGVADLGHVAGEVVHRDRRAERVQPGHDRRPDRPAVERVGAVGLQRAQRARQGRLQQGVARREHPAAGPEHLGHAVVGLDARRGPPRPASDLARLGVTTTPSSAIFAAGSSRSASRQLPPSPRSVSHAATAPGTVTESAPAHRHAAVLRGEPLGRDARGRGTRAVHDPHDAVGRRRQRDDVAADRAHVRVDDGQRRSRRQRGVEGGAAAAEDRVAGRRGGGVGGGDGVGAAGVGDAVRHGRRRARPRASTRSSGRARGSGRRSSRGRRARPRGRTRRAAGRSNPTRRGARR